MKKFNKYTIRRFVHYRDFALQSTGTVKTVLPTQILKNPFNTFQV
jgi:hypothetical protein